jgi:hypothetical protein
VLASLLVQWRNHIVHHSSYATFLLLMVASVISGTAVLRSLGLLVVGGSMLATTWIWLIEPLGVEGRIDPPAVVLGALLLGAGLYMCVRVGGSLLRRWRDRPPRAEVRAGES